MINVRITHTPSEGNYYIRKKYLKTDQMRVNYLPGLCIYKFLYTWMDLHLGDGTRVRSLRWMYWLPNPLFPFIWFRVALPRGRHAQFQFARLSPL
jgi:hypothetical protein